MTRAHDASRRRFLKVLGSASGALIVGMQLPARADAPDELLGDAPLQLNPYVRIEPDGSVVIGARDPEVGQGIRTAEARIIAEELDADWPRVVVVPLALGAEDGSGEPRWTFGHQEARGSTGMPAAWNDLRTVGAAARDLLVRAAAPRFGMDVRKLQTRLGRVIAPDGRTFGYGELATAASQLSPATNTPPKLKSPDTFRLVGQDAGDVDARDIVSGRESHAIDQMPGNALVAVIARCPYPGGELQALNADAARALKGVEQVLTIPKPAASELLGARPLAAGVAVLAQDTWTALRGR